MIRQIFKIDITTQAITRYAGATAMDSSLVTTFTSRDKVPIGVQFLDGETNKTSEILTAGAELRIGMRRYTGTGAMLALADTYTLVDDTAETTLDLNTSEMATYMDALPDPVNSKPAYIEFEVTKADGSERVTYATQAATIRCEVIPEGAEPPATAEASAANASASASAAASSATAAAASATSAAASAATAASTAIGTVRTDLNNFANSRAPLAGLVYFGGYGVIPSPASGPGTGEFAVASLVSPASIGSGMVILGSASNGVGLFVEASGEINLGLVDVSNLLTGYYLAAGKAVRLVWSRVAGVSKLYADNVLVFTSADTRNFSGAYARVGSYYSGVSPFSGTISDVWIYNRGLDAAAVDYVFKTGTPSASDYNNASNTSLMTGADSDFSSTLNWHVGGSSTISGGKLNLVDGGQCYCTAAPMLIARNYRLTVTVDSITAGAVEYYNGTTYVPITSVAGTFTVNFAAAATVSEGIYLRSNGGNAVVDTALFYNTGLVLAPDAKQPGNGLVWNDLSGNGAHIVLSTSGVSWAVPSAGSNRIRASTNTNGNQALLGLTVFPAGGVFLRVRARSRSGTPTVKLGTSSGAGDIVAAVALSTSWKTLSLLLTDPISSNANLWANSTTTDIVDWDIAWEPVGV